MKSPSIPTIIAGAVLTAVSVLNITTFHFGLPWSIGLATLLPALAAFGIGPLTGAQFQAFIELTPAEATVATTVLGGLQMVVLEIDLSNGWHAALTGLIAIAASLGFGPQIVSVVKGARATRRDRYAPARPPLA